MKNNQSNFDRCLYASDAYRAKIDFELLLICERCLYASDANMCARTVRSFFANEFPPHRYRYHVLIDIGDINTSFPKHHRYFHVTGQDAIRQDDKNGQKFGLFRLFEH